MSHIVGSSFPVLDPDDKFFRSIDTAAALCFFPGWHHRLLALLHQVRFRDQGDGDDDHDGGGVDVGAVELSL